MEVRSSSDKLTLWKSRKTTHLKFIFFIDDLMHSEVIYLAVCIRTEVKADCTVVKMTTKIVI